MKPTHRPHQKGRRGRTRGRRLAEIVLQQQRRALNRLILAIRGQPQHTPKSARRRAQRSARLEQQIKDLEAVGRFDKAARVHAAREALDVARGLRWWTPQGPVVQPYHKPGEEPAETFTIEFLDRQPKPDRFTWNP